MIPTDLINASFQAVNIGFIGLNVSDVLRARAVQGVSRWACGFFAVWSAWLIYFYWTLHSPFSLVLVALTCLANLLYFSLVLRFKVRRG